MIGTGPYHVQWEGEVYRLSLRTAPDGFIPAWEESAAQLIIAPFALRECALPPEFFLDEIRVTRLLRLIIAEAQAGGWVVRDAGGERFVQIPWPSWFDLDREVIEQMVKDFFFFVTAKIERLQSSKSFMGVPLVTSCSSLCAIWTRYIEMRSGQQDPSSKPTVPSESAADTHSGDTSSSETRAAGPSTAPTQYELAVPTRLVEMRVRGEARPFFIRRMLAEKSIELVRQKGPQLAAIHEGPLAEAEKREAMMVLFFASPLDAQQTMEAILVGDHTGVLWFKDGEPAQMVETLYDFFEGLAANAHAAGE